MMKVLIKISEHFLLPVSATVSGKATPTMPPSQLKRLKASLREQGIVGPQKSKKQKKQIAQNGTNKDKRVNRTAALAGIREQFNPFEIKANARGPKFEVTNARTVGGASGSKSVKARPGVTKGLGEENVRIQYTLLMKPILTMP